MNELTFGVVADINFASFKGAMEFLFKYFSSDFGTSSTWVVVSVRGINVNVNLSTGYAYIDKNVTSYDIAGTDLADTFRFVVEADCWEIKDNWVIA